MKDMEEGDCWYGWEGPGCMVWLVVMGLAVETVVWEARMRLREMDERVERFFAAAQNDRVGRGFFAAAQNDSREEDSSLRSE